MEIILRLSRRLERTTPWCRAPRVFTLAQGFAASLDEELDYTVELDNLRSVAATIDGGVAVPEVIEARSSSTLLVMTRLRGTPVGAAAPVLAAIGQERRSQIAPAAQRGLRQQVRTGVFHADLQPGNSAKPPNRTPSERTWKNAWLAASRSSSDCPGASTTS